MPGKCNYLKNGRNRDFIWMLLLIPAIFLLAEISSFNTGELNIFAFWFFPWGSAFREKDRAINKENLVVKKAFIPGSKINNTYIKTFFSDFPAAVELYNNARVLTWMNRVAKNKWKTSQNSLAAKIFTQRLKELKDSELNLAIERAYKGEIQIFRGEDFHNSVIRKESEKDDIEVFISPVFEHNLEISGIVMVYLNPGVEHITSLLRESQQIQSKAFLSNITHEFRTPLNWMLGFSDLIDKEKDINKIKEYNKNIQNGGKVLLTLVDRLVEMSSLVRNTSVLEPQEFSINRMLKETESILGNEIRLLEKKINVRLNIFLNDNRNDIIIKTDQLKLKQVLTYLTHNSLKFTTSGFIEIGCRELPGNMILFYVKDSGIGISGDVLHYIYEIFRKETSASPFLTQGHGLGLTVTKSYVNLMGGKIWVESESGKGAKFFFTIKNHKTQDERESLIEKPAVVNYKFKDKFKNRISHLTQKIRDSLRKKQVFY